MDTDEDHPRTTAQAFIQSDIFKDAISRAFQQHFAPYANEIATLREEHAAMRGKVAALEASVRQILEDKDSRAGTTPAVTPAATPVVTLTPAAAAASAAAVMPAAPPPSRQQLPHSEPFDGQERSLFLP